MNTRGGLQHSLSSDDTRFPLELCYLSCCCSKIPSKNNSKKEGLILAHSLRVSSMKMRKAQQQEHEAAGRMASTVMKQRTRSAVARLTFCLLFNPGPQLMEWHCRHLRWVLPHLTQSRNCFIDMVI